jgi:hypothetical protein
MKLPVESGSDHFSGFAIEHDTADPDVCINADFEHEALLSTLANYFNYFFFSKFHFLGDFASFLPNRGKIPVCQILAECFS